MPCFSADCQSASSPPDEWTLEIFGQATINVTTPSIFCFPLVDPDDLPRIVAHLEAGLSKLAQAFPWVAGKVVNEGKTANSSGVFKLKPNGQAPRLVVRDLRDAQGAPTMAALEAADFPASMMDEELLSPVNVLPGKAGEDRSPVLILQASLIEGGLLINVVGHHQALDGTGLEQVTYLLDKACRGEAFTDDEVAVGNLCRETIVQPFDDSWQPAADSRYLKKDSIGNTSPTEEPVKEHVPEPSHRWTNVAFSGEALADLKAEASKDVSSGYVSTDDALTALIWQSLARVRSARLDSGAMSTIARAINPRRYLGIPANFPGYISNNACSTRALGELVERSVGCVASELRAAVDPQSSDLGQQTREFATLLYRAADKDSLSIVGGLDLDRDLMFSSWAGQRCYAFDFGLGLGRPVAFRRPRMIPVPGLMFLLPKRPDGEIVLAMCARDDDLERLAADPTFTKYGRVIG